ncbi:EAL domain-containing protein [Clostridiaceae bacterium UIB06]|uniref:EAL domain-containing protein n=1 Tax=Clostridium thailandense TaxID=2794346 RepID=A0A949TII8_9CLOT|nr:EAL domain-containing protein [Clostridium thailandense]MCH5136295.1 EAL domain-containing protein [Clostridiaceae bacterium UIB06]
MASGYLRVDIKNGRISGFEALIRWISPELGIVPPNRFLGVAEETGLIVDLGEWILEILDKNENLQRLLKKMSQ